MAGVKGRSGGAREGSGRKSLAERYATKITTAENRISRKLPGYVDHLHALASGEDTRVEEEYQPAGLIFRDDVARDAEGTPITNPRGGAVAIKVKVYPDLDDDELVLVSRKIVQPGRDRQANQYLLDRIMGKPTERTEFSDAEGNSLPDAFEAALAKVYGNRTDDEETEE